MLPLTRIIFSGIHLPRLSTLIKKKEEEEEGKYINPDFYIHPRYYLMKCGILVRAWYSVKVNNPDNTLRLPNKNNTFIVSCQSLIFFYSFILIFGI